MTASPLIFGEVLFDHFPGGDTVLGGAPFNVAWHLHAFGAQPLLISRVGADANGAAVRTAMRSWGTDASGLQEDTQRSTGQVDIAIVGGEPHYTIRPDAAFDAIRADSLPPIAETSLLYHGTLALRDAASRAVLKTLREFSGAPVFLDVNLRAPWWGMTDVLHLIAGARWVKMNAAELDMLAGEKGDIASRARRWVGDHNLDMAIITLGAQGVLAIDAAGHTIVPRPPRATRVIGPVGAGDAFSAVLILGLINGWDMALTLKRAQDFASAILGQRGAIVANSGVYRGFCTAWRIPYAAP